MTIPGLPFPYSIVFDRDGTLLICEIGNQRIRRLNLITGVIDTYAGTGDAQPTSAGAPVAGTPLKGPRTLALAPNGDLYLALREGNAIDRIDGPKQRSTTSQARRAGYTGDGGPAVAAIPGGPKGLALAPDGALYIADTESHVIRRIDLKTGIIRTVLGTGERGNSDDADPLKCRLSRPHGVFAAGGIVCVSDSEAHRIRALR